MYLFTLFVIILYILLYGWITCKFTFFQQCFSYIRIMIIKAYLQCNCIYDCKSPRSQQDSSPVPLNQQATSYTINLKRLLRLQ